MALSEDLVASRGRSRLHAGAPYALELAVIGVIYFALAKIGLMLASINPSASPIWPPTGLALAALLLRGYRVWPAILVGAFAANAHHRRLARDLARHRRRQHDRRPARRLPDQRAVGRQGDLRKPGRRRPLRAAVASCRPRSCATIGVTSLAAGGLAEPAAIGSVWLTWWLGDLAGALAGHAGDRAVGGGGRPQVRAAASCSNRSSSSASPARSA